MIRWMKMLSAVCLMLMMGACVLLTPPDAAEVVGRMSAVMTPQETTDGLQTLHQHAVVMVSDQKIYGTYDMWYKAPDQFRVDLEVRGIVKTAYVRKGDDIWSKSRLTGVYKLEAGSAEWEQQMFDMSMARGVGMDELFESFAFAAPYDKDQSGDFYYVECQPRRAKWKHISPVTCKIGKTDYLLYGMHAKSYVDESLVTIISRMSRHRDFGTADKPWILPAVQEDTYAGSEIVQNMKLVEINKPVDERLFLEPVDEKE